MQVRLTDVAVSRLQTGIILEQPQPVCEIRPDVALADRTVFELVCMLRNDGWKWQQLPTRRSDRDALSYDVGGHRTWYSASNNPNKMYLLCLHSAQALHDQGLTPIPHFASNPAAVWGSMLRGVQPRRARAALVADVDEAQALVPARVPDRAGGPGNLDEEEVPAGFDIEAA